MIELKRTAVHKFKQNDESVLCISTITYADKSVGIIVASEDRQNSILISGNKQLGDLIDALSAVSRTIWESD